MSRLVVCSMVVVMSISLWADGTAAGGDDVVWSQASNGLQAQLSMRRSHVSNGTGIIVTYLELKNVSDIGNPMLVTGGRDSMMFRVSDTDGVDVPIDQRPLQRRGVRFARTRPAARQYLRFRIGPRGWGIPGDQAALVDLGPTSRKRESDESRPFSLLLSRTF